MFNGVYHPELHTFCTILKSYTLLLIINQLMLYFRTVAAHVYDFRRHLSRPEIDCVST